MREASLVILGLVALIVLGVWLLKDGAVRSVGGLPGVGVGSAESGGAHEPTNAPAKAGEIKAVAASGLYGVNVMSPSDVAFDGLAESLLPEWKQTIAKAKPFVTIISNTSDRRVVAFSVCFTMREGNGPPTIPCTQHRAPDALAGADVKFPDNSSERELLPGESRVLGMDFALPEGFGNDPFVKTSLENWIDDLFKQYGRSATPLITVDAVIFDDGEMVGPDTAELRKRYSVELSMKQTLYRTIIDEVGKGKSFDQAFEAAEKKIIALRDTLGDDVSSLVDKALTDQAIADVNNFRRKHGSEAALTITRKLLLEKPFEIRKTH